MQAAKAFPPFVSLEGGIIRKLALVAWGRVRKKKIETRKIFLLFLPSFKTL
jgi:hypothetical protein